MRLTALPCLMLLAVPALVLTGCTRVPELAGRVSPEALAAPSPRIASLSGLLAQGDATTLEDEDAALLRARADALQRRADRLR